MGLPGQRQHVIVVNPFQDPGDTRNFGRPGGLPGKYTVTFVLARLDRDPTIAAHPSPSPLRKLSPIQGSGTTWSCGVTDPLEFACEVAILHFPIDLGGKITRNGNFGMGLDNNSSIVYASRR